MAHTPGPWKLWNGWGPYAGDGKMRCERIGPEGGGGIHTLNQPDIVGSREDLELIAAAPDLLQACKDLHAYLTAQKPWGLPKSRGDEIARLIAKAEGR